jgi:hypothetical protein
MMVINKLRQVFILFSFAGLVIFAGCEDKKNTDRGILKGTISIGPLCPVVRIPPDPACLPTAETYKAYQVDVYTSDGVNKIAELIPSLDGNFTSELPAGNYKINLENTLVSVGRSNLPLEITIQNNDTLIINVDIDTGIR